MEISIEKLIEYAVRYDKNYGSYPESSYEGRSVVEDFIYYLCKDELISEIQKEEYLNKIYEHSFYK